MFCDCEVLASTFLARDIFHLDGEAFTEDFLVSSISPDNLQWNLELLGSSSELELDVIDEAPPVELDLDVVEITSCFDPEPVLTVCGSSL